MQRFGVYGINQFQLSWDTYEEALTEAKRLSKKYPNRYFSVGEVITVVENENVILDFREAYSGDN